MKKKVFTTFLVLLSAFPMLSTDLYLPAFPIITEYFKAEEYQTNITLFVFVLTLAIMTLLWGPISDKYGRKPVSIIGSICYLLGSLFCTFSVSITQFILFRVLQAVGGAAAVTLATAYIKDSFEKEQQESILSIVQGMALLGPASAPIIGALILRVTTWQGVFVLQTCMGAAILIGSILTKETLRDKLSTGILGTFGRLWVVFRNKRFARLLVTFSFPAIPIMAFINASPYIFENHFMLSEQAYSFFFSAQALCMVAGTLLYTKASRRFGRNSIAILCFAVVATGGAFILIVGELSPFIFIACILPPAYFANQARPLSGYLLLNAQENDTGSASALFNFGGTISSSIGIMLLSAVHGILAYIPTVGLFYLIFGAAGLASFFVFFFRRI